MSNTSTSEEQLDEAFEHWGFNEGSGMPRLPDEDHEIHIRRIARIAWHNGAYVKQYQQEDNS